MVKKEFLQGNIEYILKEISKYFSIKKFNLFIQVLENIKVGKLCGQSQYRINKYVLSKGIKGIPESIICEVIAVNIFEPKPINKSKAFSIYRLIQSL